jgi:predicted aconitase with swiveling domain
MLSMIDKVSGTIIDENHELFNRTLKNKILIFPNSVGSSVGAYVFYSLKVNKVNPIAIICTNRCDTITASGCAISDIPLVDNLNLKLESMIRNGTEIFLDADNEKIIVNKV